MIKKYIDKVVGYIDSKMKILMTILLCILGVILIFIISVVGADSFSVNKEVNQLITYVEDRRFSEAVSYYEKVTKQSSDSKKEKFDDRISKKINQVLLNYGDKYIKGEIGKDYFISLINIVNQFSGVPIDGEVMATQSKRVNDLYLDGKIDYDIAIGYMSAITNLNVGNYDIEKYSSTIKTIEQSRKLYKESIEKQDKKMYKEAIEGYDKIIKQDKKYYDLAQKRKKDCIDKMYDYYIKQAENYYKDGKYEHALDTINFVKKYYSDDEKVMEISSKYEKSVEQYSMDTEDIINLIASKGNIDKSGLRATVYQMLVNDKRYYVVDLYKNNDKINENLINPKTKQIYSYLDSNKSYSDSYSDGYWRIGKDSQIEISLDKIEAKNAISKKITKNKEQFDSIEIISKDQVKDYLDDDQIKNLNKLVGSGHDINYYALTKKGWIFKTKKVYMINPYNSSVYSLSEDKAVLLK